MKILKGNIWHLSVPDDDIVIPTNIGWRTNGQAVLGDALVSRQAASYYPLLPGYYGSLCQNLGSRISVTRYGPLLLFPVKRLNESQPYMSWQGEYDSTITFRSLEQLSEVTKDKGYIFVPLEGLRCWDRETAIGMFEEMLGYQGYFLLFEK